LPSDENRNDGNENRNRDKEDWTTRQRSLESARTTGGLAVAAAIAGGGVLVAVGGSVTRAGLSVSAGGAGHNVIIGEFNAPPQQAIESRP
jgi:hypothetical protein